VEVINNAPSHDPQTAR